MYFKPKYCKYSVVDCTTQLHFDKFIHSKNRAVCETWYHEKKHQLESLIRLFAPSESVKKTDFPYRFGKLSYNYIEMN